MAIAVPIPREYVETVWPRVKPHIERAVKRSNGWTVAAVETSVSQGHALLWAVVEGTATVGGAVTEVHDDCVYVALVGGATHSVWCREIEKVERIAVTSGIGCVKIDGRKGWTRLLRRSGYMPDACGVLTKVV